MDWLMSGAALGLASEMLGNAVLRKRSLFERRECCESRRRCRTIPCSEGLSRPGAELGRMVGPEEPDILR